MLRNAWRACASMSLADEASVRGDRRPGPRWRAGRGSAAPASTATENEWASGDRMVVKPGATSAQPPTSARAVRSREGGRAGTRDAALDEPEHEAAHVAAPVGATGVGAGGEQARDRAARSVDHVLLGVGIDAAEGEGDPGANRERPERRFDESERRAGPRDPELGPTPGLDRLGELGERGEQPAPRHAPGGHAVRQLLERAGHDGRPARLDGVVEVRLDRRSAIGPRAAGRRTPARRARRTRRPSGCWTISAGARSSASETASSMNRSPRRLTRIMSCVPYCVTAVHRFAGGSAGGAGIVWP